MWYRSTIIKEPIITTERFAQTDILLSQLSFALKTSKIDDIQKLLDLRKGGIPGQNITLAPEQLDFQIWLEIGNKSQIEMQIYKTDDESQFVIKTIYINSDKSKTEYNSYISLWTYNKIKEITL